MRQAVIYLRVSTIEQTTANQERELREIASHMGCEIVKVYRDHGISGAKGRDKRPAFDKVCRDAARREFGAKSSVRLSSAALAVPPLPAPRECRHRSLVRVAPAQQFGDFLNLSA
jgi:Resolvase, N terminal domain